MTERRLAAIVFTDMVGYTRLMAENEQNALAVVSRQRELLRPLISSHGGQWLKEMGDGTLSAFNSATNALHCAIAIQQCLQDESDFKIRIGIHLGDVVFTDEDVYGDGVNIAARVEPTAAAGGISISGAVYDTLAHNRQFETQLLGEKMLKNIGRPLRIYGISNHGLPVGEVFGSSDELAAVSSTQTTPSASWLQGAALGVLLVVAAFAFSPFASSRQAPDSADASLAATDSSTVVDSPAEQMTSVAAADAQQADEFSQADALTTSPIDEDSATDTVPVLESQPEFVADREPELLIAEEATAVEPTSLPDQEPVPVTAAPVLESQLVEADLPI